MQLKWLSQQLALVADGMLCPASQPIAHPVSYRKAGPEDEILFAVGLVARRPAGARFGVSLILCPDRAGCDGRYPVFPKPSSCLTLVHPILLTV